MTKEALWYKKNANEAVQCLLCPHRCVIQKDKTGFCRVRRNENGVLKTLIYGIAVAQALDPIEKKPLNYFCAGSKIYSLGNVGCNLSCSFCQNHTLSWGNPRCFSLMPQEALSNAKRLLEQKNIGIAFTYAEPTVWYEYVLDTAKLFCENSLKVVLVTNGFINKEPLEELLPYIAAMNIDVKAFTEDFYQNLCSARLSEVKRTVEQSAKSGCHVEVTTLIIPGFNDRDEEIEELAKWLASINDEIPLHLSRHFPRFKLQAEVTPVETLQRLKNIAAKYLKNIILGNV